MSRFKFVCAAVLALLLIACGGSSGQHGGGDPYAVSSYSSDAVSSADLSGLWMIISSYKATRFSEDSDAVFDRRQRMLMLITQDASGFKASLCNETPETRDHFFSDSDAELSFYDDRIDLFMSLSVDSNVRMNGEYQSSANTEVHESSVFAVKIADRPSAGTLNLSYTVDGESFSQSGVQVSCFLQSRGSTYSEMFGRDYFYETTEFFAELQIGDSSKEVFLDLVERVDADEGRPPELDMDIRDLGIYFDAEEEGHVVLETRANAVNAIDFKVDAVDDYYVDDVVSVEFSIDF